MAILKIVDCGERFFYQGPRYTYLGPESGQEFRDDFFIPWLKKNIDSTELIVDFMGTVVYTPSFLEECFGGAIRKGYLQVKKIQFVNMKEDEQERAEGYIKEAKPE